MKSLFAIAALGLACAAASGCVTSRPARNGVFNENIYLRKDFLVRGTGADGKPLPDPGWMLEATITGTSSPNPLGGSPFNLYPGIHNYLGYVRFRVQQDHLDIVDQRELSATQSTGRIPEVVNSWQATNVDLKYRVNLDGEQTNFYEENQELPWQQRQWVKLNPAKNDLSDIAVLGLGFPDLLNHCASTGESEATLVPDSVVIDEKNNYVQWTTQITVPLRVDLGECIEAYGDRINTAAFLDRPNVTMNLMYSLTRANPSPTYQPLIIAEKDPIRHKYGPLLYIGLNRDEDSGQLAASEYVIRFDPQKDESVWYFDKGFPEKYKKYFLDPAGVKDRTNEIMQTSGAKLRFDFRNYDDPRGLTDIQKDRGGREFGDIRYNWFRWMSDKDMQDMFAGVTEPYIDPRTGETLSNTIVFNEFAIKDYYVQRIDAFLQSMGASEGVNSPLPWSDPGPCYDGDVIPILDKSLKEVNGKSTLYQKMQTYLGHTTDVYGAEGPSDFIPKFIKNRDPDFFRAFYAATQYDIYRDPDSNPFVIREGGRGVYGPGGIWQMLKDEREFHQRAAEIDRGKNPYDMNATGPDGIKAITSYLRRMKELTINHRDWTLKKDRVHPHIFMDTSESFSFEQIIQRDARHCITVDGVARWETKEEWVQNLIDTYWSQVIWHEFGHGLGLDHNFMASVDAPHFPKYKDNHGGEHYGLYSSSVMEYNSSPDRVFWHGDWGPYDKGAIGWIYANSGTAQGKAGTAISGQNDAMTPWRDPLGFTGNQEEAFMFCNADHMKYTPFCRAGDMGTSASEIMANAISNYEWQYHWRNFRVFRKFWNDSRYADIPANMIIDARRFLSTWIFDWSGAELADTFRRLEIKNPDPNGSDLLYYAQLTDKFNEDASSANQMLAAFHKAIIQQGSGERPYATVYDKYYGDVTQQGIILDKLFAMLGFVALWPTDNYDQNQAGGYIASFAAGRDRSYEAVAEDTVSSMIGGQYNVYPYFKPFAVVQFAADTHAPEFVSFSGQVEVRDWVGGQVFNRLQDFLDYFRDLAVQSNYTADGCGAGFDTCRFDPRPLSDSHNEFWGPDKRRWIWTFVPDRNQYVASRKDRNIASYIVLRDYNDDVVTRLDDGDNPGGAYGLELPVKYMLDAFAYYR